VSFFHLLPFFGCARGPQNGRLPFECLQTYARHEEARSRKKAATAQQQQQQQLGYTWQDDRAILKLMRIWGRWWTISTYLLLRLCPPPPRSPKARILEASHA
jgi:hypothetical protein